MDPTTDFDLAFNFNEAFIGVDDEVTVVTGLKNPFPFWFGLAGKPALPRGFRNPFPFWLGLVGGSGAVVPPEPPQPPAGSGLPHVVWQPAPVIGSADIVLPALLAAARGVHGVAGTARVLLPAISGAAHGEVVRSGRGVGSLSIAAAAAGEVGFSAVAAGTLSLIFESVGAVGRVGTGSVHLGLKGDGHGLHNPDDPAIIALLLAT